MIGPVNVVVAGSRGFTDYKLLCETLDRLLPQDVAITILSGTARGADSLGERYALDRGLAVRHFPANWKLHGKVAGLLRNEEMLRCAALAIFFWDGSSRGTAHAVITAAKLDVPYHIINYAVDPSPRLDKDGLSC
jgi:hypothetical protein